ncbi:MAG: glycyl-radical enzyme activating protein [Spirochaetaceae bacterium]|nr:MAG: glycyl-radical enzyme activating protein [Spirochaetaceae bacterium]
MTSGTIFDIKRYAVHDGPGIRTTVFFKGCPLHCRWCHNPESQASSPTVLYRHNLCVACGRCVAACPKEALRSTDSGIKRDFARCTNCGTCIEVCLSGAMERVGRRISSEELIAEIERDIPFFDESGGGVTFSGGEPLAQPEFLSEMLDLCAEREIHRTVDTCGFSNAKILASIAGKTDLFLFDIKIIDAELHRQVTGRSNSRILENLRWLSESGYRVEVRIPVIPAMTDGTDNIDAAGALLSSLSNPPAVRLLPFHRTALEKYKRFGMKVPSEYEGAQPSEADMQRVARLLEIQGLTVMYDGGRIAR